MNQSEYARTEGNPEKPDPLNFGLTELRVQWFDARSGSFFHYLATRHHQIESVLVILLSIALVSLIYFGRYVKSIQALGYGWAVLLAAILVAGPVSRRYNFWVIKRAKDYDGYASFVEAKRNYESRLRLIALRRREERESQRRELFRRRTAPTPHIRQLFRDWKSASGYKFEEQLFELFRNRKYDVQWTGKRGSDGGIDIRLKIGKRRVIIQCKSHKGFLSAGPVRELYGTLQHDAADQAWLIARNGFYSGAKEFALGKPIKLFTLQDILEEMEAPVIQQLSTDNMERLEE